MPFPACRDPSRPAARTSNEKSTAQSSVVAAWKTPCRAIQSRAVPSQRRSRETRSRSLLTVTSTSRLTTSDGSSRDSSRSSRARVRSGSSLDLFYRPVCPVADPSDHRQVDSEASREFPLPRRLAGPASLTTARLARPPTSQSFFYHPSEQRIIVRILFMPILCASPSWARALFRHADSRGPVQTRGVRSSAITLCTKRSTGNSRATATKRSSSDRSSTSSCRTCRTRGRLATSRSRDRTGPARSVRRN